MKKSKFLIISAILLLAFVEKVSPNPNYAPVLYNLGNQYLKNGRKNTAINYYKRALCSNPLLPGVNYKLGLLSIKNENIQKAEKYFHREMHVSSSSHEPYYQLSLIYLDNGEFAKALEYIKRALKIRYDIQYQYVYGLACLRNGLLHDAKSKVEDLESGGYHELADKLRKTISEYK